MQRPGRVAQTPKSTREREAHEENDDYDEAGGDPPIQPAVFMRSNSSGHFCIARRKKNGRGPKGPPT